VKPEQDDHSWRAKCVIICLIQKEIFIEITYLDHYFPSKRFLKHLQEISMIQNIPLTNHQNQEAAMAVQIKLLVSCLQPQIL
jgi:hypothetical protein